MKNNQLIKILPIPALKDNYMWMGINAQNQAFVVDPGDANPVIKTLKQYGLTLAAVFITHHHRDHTFGMEKLASYYHMPIFGPINEKLPEITHQVKEGDRVELEGFPTFNVLEIPGHTLDHLAYYSDGILFCGDTLFSAGCGRLFEGTAEQLYQSLLKLKALPDDTQIYCGHEYTQNNLRFAEYIEPHNEAIKAKIAQVNDLREKNQPTLPSLLKEEIDINPFFRCEVPDVIRQVEDSTKKSMSTLEVFAELREWKNHY